MRKIYMLALLLAASLFPLGAQAGFTCPPLPFTFSNGTIADGTQVNANFNSVQTCAAAAGNAGGGGGIGSDTRISLTAPLQLWVAPGGSDSGNNCQTQSTPCATIQNAYNQTVTSYDTAGFVVNIHAAAGSYAAGLKCSGQQVGIATGNVVPAYWSIVGAGKAVTTIADVTSNPGAIIATGQCNLGLQGLKLTSANGSDIYPQFGGNVSVNGDMELGTSRLAQIHTEDAAAVKITTSPVTFSGTSQAAVEAILNSVVVFPETPMIVQFMNGAAYNLYGTFHAMEGGVIYVNKFFNTMVGENEGTFTGYATGNTLTILTASADTLSPTSSAGSCSTCGSVVTGTGVASNTQITAILSGSGGVGTYTFNGPTQTFGSAGSPVSLVAYDSPLVPFVGSAPTKRFLVSNGGGIETTTDVTGNFIPGNNLGEIDRAGWYSPFAQTGVKGPYPGLGSTGSATVQNGSTDATGVLVLAPQGSGISNQATVDLHFATNQGSQTAVCFFTADDSGRSGSSPLDPAVTFAAAAGTTTNDYFVQVTNGSTVFPAGHYYVQYSCSPF